MNITDFRLHRYGKYNVTAVHTIIRAHTLINVHIYKERFPRAHYRKFKNYTIKNWHNATGYIQWRRGEKTTNKQPNARKQKSRRSLISSVLFRWFQKQNKTMRWPGRHINHFLPLTIWNIYYHYYCTWKQWIN